MQKKEVIQSPYCFHTSQDVSGSGFNMDTPFLCSTSSSADSRASFVPTNPLNTYIIHDVVRQQAQQPSDYIPEQTM